MLVCDHVALVVRELEPVVDRLTGLGVAAEPVEEFPEEGTREVYLGAEAQPGRVLLLQPLGPDGPYARALAKRGPGLHHVAVRAPDARALVRQRPGWLLLPHSLESYDRSRTLWLARPGVGTLVEVQEGAARYEGAPLVERLELPVGDPARAALLAGLGGTTELAAGPGVLTLAGRAVAIAALVG